MRKQLLDFIKTQKLGGFRVDDALPRNESGESLYLKNPRRIYVDQDQTDVNPIIIALNGLNISTKVTRVTVYFSTDAKLLSANYDELLDLLQEGRNIAPEMGFNSRDCAVRTSYENDLLVTELEYSYTKLI